MILALDYGDKRVGVAASDPTGILATALPALAAEPFDQLLSQLQKIITERSIQRILVGMPRNMDGTYGPSAQKVRAWIEKLKTRITLPIQTVDERLSTVEASRRLHEAGYDTRQQKTKIDSASAQILLENFLSTANL